jgi:hypothetical protein
MSKSALSKILINGSNNPREVGGKPSGTPVAPAHDSSASAGDGQQRRASLYEDTLSNRPSSRWYSVIWVFFALIVVAGVVAVFLGSSADERILQLAENRAKAAGESELSKVEAEVREQNAATPSSENLPPVQEPGQDANLKRVPSPSPTAQSPAGLNETLQSPVKSEPVPSRPPPAPAKPAVPVSTPDPVSPAPVQEKLPSPSNVQPTVSVPAQTEVDRVATGSNEPPDASAESPSQTAEAAVGPGPENTAAYEALIQNSQAAAKIIVGAYPTLTYQSWRVVQRNDREIWVDLIANWTNGGSEVHFIWSVSRDGKTVRALSEAARNLERET